jgi:predicted AAA+ superfamily ATPase
MERYLKLQILEDLDEKMVFLAGPRQVGKTTLSKSLFKVYRQRLVRLEVSSNEQFNDLATIEIMLNRLPDLVNY